MSRKAIDKVIKKLKSADDNDKLAALAYITKIFPDQDSLAKCDQIYDIWGALRATHFLERAIKSKTVQDLAFHIISVFCHIIVPREFVVFLPLLKALFPQEGAENTFIEIISVLNDCSILFDQIEFTEANLDFFIKATRGAKRCSMSSAVCNARRIVFRMFEGNEPLSLRKKLFVFITYMGRITKWSFCINSRPGCHDLSPYLFSLTLAMIEIRLQLDTPLNYKEIEAEEKAEREKERSQITPHEEEEEDEKVESAPNMKFSRDIGPLIDNTVTAASCLLLETAVPPLVEYEEEFSDAEVSIYFQTLNQLISESLAIFHAAEGPRDSKRLEMHALLSVFAIWLRDGDFLVGNRQLQDSFPAIAKLLKYFPEEALQFLPAFSQWSVEFLIMLRNAGFLELFREIRQNADENEAIAIEKIFQTVGEV